VTNPWNIDHSKAPATLAAEALLEWIERELGGEPEAAEALS